MDTEEVICLSSDDEKSKFQKSCKIEIKKSSSPRSPASENLFKRRQSSISSEVKRICLNEHQNKQQSNKYNKMIKTATSDVKPSTSGYKMVNGRLEYKRIEPKNISKSSTSFESCTTAKHDITNGKKLNVEKIDESLDSSVKSNDENHDDVLNKPLLIVKEKHPVNILNGNEDAFAMFISQCLQRDRSEDMQKIVAKLKRRYEQLDKLYAQSEAFGDLLKEKRDCLMNEQGYLYRHIQEVSNEMKSKKLGKCNYADFDSRPANKCNNYMIDNEYNEAYEVEEAEEEETPAEREKSRKLRLQIKKIEKTMEIVQKRIAKYEEAEVNFDDEDDSSFLKLERYKKRMVDLHAMWCKYTKNDVSAGRQYLLPKHFNKLTGIVTVDQAINSFVNAKLAKRRNQINKQSAVDCIIFPDYVDILNLIHTHNISSNLGMDNRAEKSAAKTAFIKLGEYLKRTRQQDVFDSFAAFYENDDDPANKNPELLGKLQENRDAGEKKLSEVFEEFSKRQEEIKIHTNTDQQDNNAQKKKSEDEVKNHDDDNDDDDDDNDDEDEDDYDDDDNEKDVSDEDANVSICESIIDSDDVQNIDKMDVDGEDRELVDVAKDDEIIMEKSQTPAVKPTITNKKQALNNENMQDEKCKNGSDNIIEAVNSSAQQAQEKSLLDSDNENQVNDVKHGAEQLDCNKDVDAAGKQPVQPMLKLRSFARPSEYWQNSQDSNDENNEVNKNKKASSTIPVEVIDVDVSDERPENLSSNKNITSNQNSTSKCILKIVSKNGNIKKSIKGTVVITNPELIRQLKESKKMTVSHNTIKFPPKAVIRRGAPSNIRIVPITKNITPNVKSNVPKPSTSDAENTKSINKVVQSSIVTMMARKVINPLAKQRQNGQNTAKVMPLTSKLPNVNNP